MFVSNGICREIFFQCYIYTYLCEIYIECDPHAISGCWKRRFTDDSLIEKHCLTWLTNQMVAPSSGPCSKDWHERRWFLWCYLIILDLTCFWHDERVGSQSSYPMCLQHLICKVSVANRSIHRGFHTTLPFMALRGMLRFICGSAVPAMKQWCRCFCVNGCFFVYCWWRYYDILFQVTIIMMMLIMTMMFTIMTKVHEKCW